jgi:hypothetical protein
MMFASIEAKREYVRNKLIATGEWHVPSVRDDISENAQTSDFLLPEVSVRTLASEQRHNATPEGSDSPDDTGSAERMQALVDELIEVFETEFLGVWEKDKCFSWTREEGAQPVL